ncbi:MAG: hypothetical protein AB7D46_04560 [Flavobacteriaceae bacterium]
MKLLLTIIFLFVGTMSFGQEQFSKKEVRKFQKELNKHYADPEKSPLTE